MTIKVSIDASGGDFASGVHFFLVMLLVDVTPPRLRVADEVHLGEFLEDGVEPLDAGVVVAVLEVHQHRHFVFPRQLGDALDVFRVALDSELLLSDPHRALFQIRFNCLDALGMVGDLVGEVDVVARVFDGDPAD